MTDQQPPQTNASLNSIASRVEISSLKDRRIPEPPKDLQVFTETQLIVWNELSVARYDLRASDLRVLHSLVLIECEIAELREQLSKEGCVIPGGLNPIKNPLLGIIKDLFAQSMALRRALQLNTPAASKNKALRSAPKWNDDDSPEPTGKTGKKLLA